MADITAEVTWSDIQIEMMTAAALGGDDNAAITLLLITPMQANLSSLNFPANFP